MMLSPCRCCEREISDEAPTCPYCGQPDPHGKARDEKLFEDKVKNLIRRGDRVAARRQIIERFGETDPEFIDWLLGTYVREVDGDAA